MARPLKPLVKSGGYYPSNRWTPLVYPGGYTTENGGGQPEPEAVLKTVTGSLIHITNALALPAKALSANISPIQDLHGYDAPWPAGGGKNKIPDDYNFASGTTKQGVTATINADGSIRIVSAGTGTGTAFFDLNVQSAPNIVLPAGTYVASGAVSGKVHLGIKDAALNTNLLNPFTLSEETGIFAYLSCVSNTAYDVTIYPQLEAGNTATPWAPFSNICPISGRTSATVTRTGKNLFNADAPNLVNGYITGTGFSSANANAKTVYIQIKPNSTYTVSKLASQRFIIATSDVIPSNGATFTARQANTNMTVKTITSGANDAYLWAWVYLEDADTVALEEMLASVQIELGSTATAYEPYHGNTYTITLGDTVYGGTLDVTGGKMVVDRAMYTFSESDVWIKYETGGKMTFNSGDRFPVGVDTRKPCIMSNYPFIKTAYISIQPDKSFSLFSSPWLSVCDSGYSDASTFASAMAGNQLVYYLATPIEITLTPTQIEMLLGENNLWSDAGDSTLTYYAEGEASTSEALGILLGGTYNNPGCADDASDDEALGILLGGS